MLFSQLLHRLYRFSFVVCLIVILSSCSQSQRLSNDTSVLFIQKSAEYDALCQQTYNLATDRLKTIIENRAGNSKLAVVLDLDETVLSNVKFNAGIIKSGQVYSKDLWNQWVNKQEATLVSGALEFLKFAEAHQVEIFYISNRYQSTFAATLANLKLLGVPIKDESHLLLRNNDKSKDARRNLVSEEFSIVMYIGDALGDFASLYDGIDSKTAHEYVKSDASKWGVQYIILPNPMYGSWMYSK